MTPRPPIDTWHSPAAPTMQAWIARFRDGKGGYFPLIFHEATQERVERAAIDFWSAEKRKLEARATQLERVRSVRRGKAAA